MSDAQPNATIHPRLEQALQMPRIAIESTLPVVDDGRFAAKAIIWAARRNPQVNASWHDTHYTLKNYVNLGIAAAKRGAVDPVKLRSSHGRGTDKGRRA